MFKEDIEWFISFLKEKQNSLIVDAAWKNVPMYRGYSGVTVDELEEKAKNDEDFIRRKKILDIEIRKWEAQLDFLKEKEQ